MDYTWWEIALALAGLSSFISVLVILFFPVGKGPTCFVYTGDIPDWSSPDAARVIARALGLSQQQGDTVEVLNNGDAFLAQFLTDIDAATSSIHILMYIWSDGVMSDAVFAHLRRRLDAGVEVRIVIDAFGSGTDRPTAQLDAFERAGGRYTVFRSLSIAPWHLLKNRARNHARALIIDGRIAYTGGIACNDLWLGDARTEKEYRDTMFRVRGTMAHDLQAAFSQAWTAMTGEILLGKSYFPTIHGSIARHPYVPLMSTPTPDTVTLAKLILLSVLSARKSVLLTTPYFLTDEPLRTLLKEKARSGIDVHILVPGEHTDVPSVRYASRYRYEDLLGSGVRIYEYNDTFIHSKSLVIDTSWSVIGSANTDFRSRNINDEFVFGIADPVLSRELADIFYRDTTRATEVDVAVFRKRGLWERVREYTDLIFVQQY